MFLGLVISVIPRKSVIFGGKSVGVAGFEPATSCSQSRRDNRATLYPEKVGKSINIYRLNKRRGRDSNPRYP